MPGIYFHIPFCKRICAYCDFYRSADLSRMAEVVEAMHRELETRRGYLHDERIRTIYFGGGTPSLLSPETLHGFLTHAASLFDCTGVTETTLEANPDDLTQPYLEAIRSAGVNRLSIGIQSFDDRCLKLMNRRHTAAQATEVVRTAQRAGFDNITVDLIFGVPGFAGDSLRHSLDEALGLGVQHISAYHLTIEPATTFGRRAARGELREVDESVSEAEFAQVHDTLTAAGYEHYEVSNYALPGCRAQHNAAYWQGDEYLGIGPAAHSFDGRSRSWNVDSVAQYLAGEEGGSEILTERDRFNEYVMTSLRTAAGIDTVKVKTDFGSQRLDRLLTEAAHFTASGMLFAEGERLRIPPERMLVSDTVIEALFETQPRHATK